MAEKKNFAQKSLRGSLYGTLSILFYISKVFGLIPYSFTEFYMNKKFKVSLVGNIWCICCSINFFVQYHLLIQYHLIGQENTAVLGALTFAIGIFIIYIQAFMMIVDVFAGLINQKSLIDCLERLEKVEQDLAKENILLDYNKIKRNQSILVAICIIGEASLTVYNYFYFLNDLFNITSLWYFLTGVPLFINGIAKIWFLVLILMIQQRLQAVNNYLNDTKQLFLDKKLKYSSKHGMKEKGHDEFYFENIGYLEREIFTIKNANQPSQKEGWDYFKNISNASNKINDITILSPKKTNNILNVAPKNDQKNALHKTNIDNFYWNDNEFIVSDKMDNKLISLCKYHDEICEIAKLINRLFSFQILITMGFTFLAITAQFYFLYCGLAKQTIPILFRSASSIEISVIFITYTAYKCVLLIYISWRTKIDAQKTGIQLHKIANVVDENHFYNVSNHLSLKLLSHQGSLNFTACGFFNLDMTTIYAITGGITSYLIILIQFNLAANRSKAMGPSNGTALAGNKTQ